MMRGLSICTGIGGADLAAEMTQGIEIVGQVECEPFCLAVLEHYWPEVKRVERIQDVRGDEWGNIDICIAGIPCQPFSDAGRQRGSADERNLWPDMRRILSSQCKRGEPYRWFILENVRGLLHVHKGEFFKGIINDLATLGYRVGWCVYGACEVGAPHRRERVFVVAHHTGIRRGRRQADEDNRQRHYHQADVREDGPDGIMADTERQQQQRGRDPEQLVDTQGTCKGREEERERFRHAASNSCTPMADTGTQGLPQRERTTDTGSSRPAIVGPGSRSTKSEMGGGIDGLSNWLAEYSNRWPAGPDREQEAWEPPRVVLGRMLFRVAQIKALGNAIVPQQLALLLREIVKVEEG